MLARIDTTRVPRPEEDRSSVGQQSNGLSESVPVSSSQIIRIATKSCAHQLTTFTNGEQSPLLVLPCNRHL